MVKLFGYHAVLTRPSGMRVGSPVGDLDVSPEPVQQLFAFSSPIKSGPPRVFSYENSENGRRALANLIRGERVLRVILGVDIPFESMSVVDLQVGEHLITNRTVISSGS